MTGAVHQTGVASPSGKLKGQYKGAREMAHDIEMLNSQLATLESDHNKMELENRSIDGAGARLCRAAPPTPTDSGWPNLLLMVGKCGPPLPPTPPQERP